MSDIDAATSTAATTPAREHLAILDGLRGVASLMVVVSHLLQASADGDPQKQIVNHGYIAVDSFFLLSGFVLAHAYDDRWSRMGLGAFLARRLIRLHPMVVAGSVVGAALFAFQDYAIFARYGSASAGAVLFAMVLGCLMIPLPKSADIRGWDEIYPLNGPA